MKLLLDTHALIWFALGDARLPKRAREVSNETAWDAAGVPRIWA